MKKLYNPLAIASFLVYGSRLVPYEGGQHLVGIRGAENDDALTALLTAANADPRMGKLYDLRIRPNSPSTPAKGSAAIWPFGASG